MTMHKLQGRSVIVGDGNVEKALRKFKKKIQSSNLLNELREREHYTKPSVEKKLKKAAAKNRWRKHLNSQSLPPKLY